MTVIRLCEEPRWDAGTHCLCKHAGFARCILHNQPLIENNEGWRTCCFQCTTPYYTMEMKPGEDDE